MKDRSKAGFTLIELAVALAIVVVAMGLVIVRTGGLSADGRVRSSARSLGSTIRLYREKAMLEETTYILSLDLEKGVYEVSVPRGRTREVLSRKVLGKGVTFAEMTVGRRDEKGKVSLFFDPRGVIPSTCITVRDKHDNRVSLVAGELLNEIEYMD